MLVTFKTPEEADACIAAIHRRWFGGRQLDASTYDGRTKYYTKETEEERAARLNKWNEFLQGKKSSQQTEVSGQPENEDGKKELDEPVSHTVELAIPDNVDNSKSSVVTEGIDHKQQDSSS